MEDKEIEQEQIPKNGYNLFFTFILSLNILGSIIRQVAAIAQHPIPLFSIISSIMVLIHVSSLVMILKEKKSGLYLFICNVFIFSFMISPIINEISDYNVFDIQRATIGGIIQIMVMFLLLFLKSKGKSGYDVLFAEKELKTKSPKLVINKNMNEKIVSIIVYSITGIVLVLSVIALFILL